MKCLPLLLFACLLTSCQTTSFEESDSLPEGRTLERLAYVSQLDELEDTVADYARCSCAATLSAYLLLGGDFETVAREFGVEPELTYANVHRVQEALYHHANVDGEPGIYGSSIPSFDEEGRLTGWERHPEDEYHRVLEALGLGADRVYGPTRETANDKRVSILEWTKRPAVFIVGVDEDMEHERFGPMHKTGNHYIAIHHEDGRYHALDSFRTPGNRAHQVLTDQEVEDNLFETPNAIFVVFLPGS